MLISIKKEGINSLIKMLIKQNHKIIGVKKRENQFIFDRIKNPEEFTYEYLPTLLPVKKYLMPNKETLFKYEKSNQEYHEPADNSGQDRYTVYFGLRFCDLESIKILDNMLLGEKRDSYYEKKRRNSLLFVFDCKKMLDQYCFCDAVFDKEYGTSDAVFFENNEDAYTVLVNSDIAKCIFDNIKEYWIPAKDENEYKKTQFENTVKLKDKKEKLMDEDLLFAICSEEAKNCFECGSCFLVCPTCYCFSIEDEDEINMKTGQRKRVWDGCMLKDFTLVAGGHRLVANGVERAMHRFKRKYSNALKKQNRFLCVGCGRCSRSCPADNNIKKILEGL